MMGEQEMRVAALNAAVRASGDHANAWQILTLAKQFYDYIKDGRG